MHGQQNVAQQQAARLYASSTQHKKKTLEIILSQKNLSIETDQAQAKHELSSLDDDCWGGRGWT